MLLNKIHDAENGSRYWQREYNRLLYDMSHKFQPPEKPKSGV